MAKERITREELRHEEKQQAEIKQEGVKQEEFQKKRKLFFSTSEKYLFKKFVSFDQTPSFWHPHFLRSFEKSYLFGFRIFGFEKKSLLQSSPFFFSKKKSFSKKCY